MNERELIEQMDRNKAAMDRIDRLFFISSFTCILLNGFLSFIKIFYFPIAFILFDFLSVLECLLAPASVVFSVFSSCKREKYTLAALWTFLIRTILMIFISGYDSSIPYLLMYVIPQFLCLRQYDKLRIMKGQFGYPDFNAAIYGNKPYSSMETEFFARMNRRRRRRANPHMDKVTPPPTYGDYEDIFSKRKKPL